MTTEWSWLQKPMYWLPRHIYCSTSSGLWRDKAESVAGLVDLMYGVSRVSAFGSNDCACIQTYGVWDIFFLLFSLSLLPVGKTKSNGSGGFNPALSAGVPREEGIIKSDLFYPSIPDQVLCLPKYSSSKNMFLGGKRRRGYRSSMSGLHFHTSLSKLA